MIFTGIENPYGTNAAFASVAYPMPDLQNKKAVRKVKRSLRIPAAPKPLSYHLKNLLLS